MFEPIRGGTRGGQAEFKWSDVSADKDREVRRNALTSESRTDAQRRRITLDTVSMHRLEDGRRIRMCIGTAEI